jgi:ATP-binding cassette subfamily C protein/ATP-binding cassette subfamily C protein LapB
MSRLAGAAAPDAGPGPVIAARDDLWSSLDALKTKTDLSACLPPLLKALHWNGDGRQLAESLPHFTDELDLTGLRNTLALLRFESRMLDCRIDALDRRLLPCLFLPEGRPAIVLIRSEGETILIFDAEAETYREVPVPDWPGSACLFSRRDETEVRHRQSRLGWFATIAARFRGLAGRALAITLALNLLALITPLFVMSVYDRVLPTGSLPTLVSLAVGVFIAITGDQALRAIRGRVVSHIGMRLDLLVGTAILEKIVSLPAAFVERATVGAQISRLRDFENVREFFTGPLAFALFEFPFAAVFIIALAFIAGPVALVPVGAMVGFVTLALALSPIVRLTVARTARAGALRQEFLAQMVPGMRAIRYASATDVWIERHRELSAAGCLAGFRACLVSALIDNLAHLLMGGAGLATIAFGVLRVFEGAMTPGALVAAMILVWRVLAPLQTGFVMISRLTQVRSSVRQIDALMNLRAERDLDSALSPLRKLAGSVSFSHVSIRYAAEVEPALVGIEFAVNPGEVVAIVGPTGAGKSTVLKLILGLFAPQAGSIRLDNTDIRQLDSVRLRCLIGYLPQECGFFYGTLAQNLRLAQPTATDGELRVAAEAAGVLDDILALPQGFDTRIGDAVTQQLPASFRQQLGLARAFLKQGSILLLDEPGNGLDYNGDQALIATVERLKGATTVFMVTHRPSHLRLADKILWLDSGRIRAFGPASEVATVLPEEFR